MTNGDDYAWLRRTFNEDAERCDRARPWTKVYAEMSIVAIDEVWRLTGPWFNEMRSAHFQPRPPSGPADDEHEDALREQMLRELGR